MKTIMVTVNIIKNVIKQLRRLKWDSKEYEEALYDNDKIIKKLGNEEANDYWDKFLRSTEG